MSSSDSIEPSQDDSPAELDPVVADAVDGVTNRFGTDGLEQMIEYAEQRLAEARAALAELARSVD